MSSHQVEVSALSNTLSGKGLVTFYSSTGNTKQVAESIARALGFDIEAIQEPTTRVLTLPPKGLGGFVSFMMAGFEATTRRTVPLLTMERDPSQYAIVVVGTPVWAGNPASPTRSFLVAQGKTILKAAFFYTGGDANNPKVIPAMEMVSGRRAVATLAASAEQVHKGQYAAQVDALAEALSQ
jgi:menaquinone-dependent protoporphyrinogen IX oxidase